MKADVTKKTVLSMEKDKPCFLFTLQSLATALGVEPSELLAGSVQPPPDMSRTVRIVIKRRGDIEELDETDMVIFAEALGRIIGAAYSIEVIKVTKGSIAITLQFDIDDAFRFVEAGNEGLLDELGLEFLSLHSTERETLSHQLVTFRNARSGSSIPASGEEDSDASNSDA